MHCEEKPCTPAGGCSRPREVALLSNQGSPEPSRVAACWVPCLESHSRCCRGAGGLGFLTWAQGVGEVGSWLKIWACELDWGLWMKSGMMKASQQVDFKDPGGHLWQMPGPGCYTGTRQGPNNGEVTGPRPSRHVQVPFSLPWRPSRQGGELDPGHWAAQQDSRVQVATRAASCCFYLFIY